MDVERGSIDSNNVPQAKPSSRGPDDLAYSMKRWHEQQPHEEPYCGLTIGSRMVSGHGELLIELVMLYFHVDHEAKIWVRRPASRSRKERVVGDRP